MLATPRSGPAQDKVDEQMDQQAGPVVEAARDLGLLIITAGKGDIIPLVPPLTVTDEEISQCCAVIREAAGKVLK